MASLYMGYVLAHCPACRAIIEVQDGWTTPKHGECGGGQRPVDYEKFRHEAASRDFHQAKKEKR
jgi:hypothetical protein